MRRRYLGWCLAGLTVLMGCAPKSPEGAGEAPPPAEAKRKVVVYSPHGREMLEPFAKRFESAYPDISVETVDMGSQAVLDRLRAEKANPYADVWWGAPHTMFTTAAKEDLLEPYQPSWAEQIDASNRDPEFRWCGQYRTPIVIVYNSDLLDEQTAPQHWDDLITGEWKDKVLIRNPLESGTMRTFFAAMILREENVEAGFTWLQALDANTKAYPANPALLYRQLSTQEGQATVWVLRDVEIQKRVNGYHLGYVIPSEGVPVILDAIATVKGAKHPEAAKLFYEFVTAPEQMIWSAEEFDTMPARNDIPADKLPERMPKDVPELDLDWSQIDAHGPEWMERWDRTVRTAK